MTSSVAGQRRSSEALPTARLALKNSHVWWSAGGFIHYSFLNPCETLRLRNMPSKLMRCPQNCNACSWYWSTEGAQFNSMTMPDQKLNDLGYKMFPHPPYSPDLLPTNYHFFKHFTTFCMENFSTTSRRQKMLSKSSMNSQSMDFML